MRTDAAKPTELSVYVHVPFCRSRCPYCSFLSYADKESWIGPYAESLLEELSVRAAAGAFESREIASVYIGGGSPLLFGKERLTRLVEEIRKRISAPADCEVTLEANPCELDPDYACALSDSGVTRFSIGVQSLDPTVLAALGRRHGARDALEAVDAARKSGVQCVSCDLIFGVLGQSVASWEDTLRRVTELGPEHVSAYELRPAGNVQAAPEKEVCSMMELTCGLLREHGYRRYEISNFALEGFQCRHNVGYWTGRDYVGLGAGAQSLFSGRRWSNTASIEGYIHSIAGGLIPISWSEKLTPDETLSETVFLSIRTADGLDLVQLDSVWSDDLDRAIGDLCSSGLMRVEDAALHLTANGFMVSDAIVSRLIGVCDRHF